MGGQQRGRAESIQHDPGLVAGIFLLLGLVANLKINRERNPILHYSDAIADPKTVWSIKNLNLEK